MKSKQIILEMGIVVVSVLYGLGNVVSADRTESKKRPEPETQATRVIIEKRVQVRPEDLPEQVRKTLNDKSYAGWTIQDAYLVTADDGSQYFELVVRKTDEQSRMKIDKNGQVLN
ncbi:hypothetical protein [Dyadobacter sp. CY326]|uniref:hypothetical protein n=1 Tax=Dyadobacter sp. CY326 TaxID=2907300 RepID=UPI001F37A66F|nr:hypothetical protein [Dyadobacter sp. CY326]MCE7065953.1 hypothetical protein [Dyadobacter sp. CY326]